MTIPSTLSNILIEGNTIDAGSSTYTALLTTIGADCRIFGNYFSGIGNDAINNIMLTLAAGTCNVQGNTFVRGASNISGYIFTDGSEDQIITSNIFDGYTTDGSNLALTAGLSTNSLYTANKNQVGYAIIPLATEKVSIFQYGSFKSIFKSSDVPPNTSTDYGVASGFLYDPYVLQIFEDAASPSDRYFSINVDISKSIPIGAKIIDAKISVYNPSSILLDTGSINQFNLFLTAGLDHTSSIDVKTYQSAGALSVMVGYLAQSQLNINAGNEANMRSAYQVIEIPTLNFTGTAGVPGSTGPVVNSNISSNFVVDNDRNISANLQFYYHAASQGTTATPLIVVSPLIVTYVW